MNLTIRMTMGSAAPQPTINAYIVKHDIELAQWGFVGRGEAEVFPGGVDAKSKMNRNVQEWWAYGLLWPRCPFSWNEDRKKQAWRALTQGVDPGRAFTNGTGTDTLRDYITPQNLDQEDAAMDKFRVCGGGLVNVLGGDEATESFGGVKHRKVEAVDAAGVLPWEQQMLICNRERTPWLVQLAVISNGYNVFQFPQLGGNDVPFPLLSPGGFNWLPVEILRKYTGAQPWPGPYVPPR